MILINLYQKPIYLHRKCPHHTCYYTVYKTYRQDIYKTTIHKTYNQDIYVRHVR